MRPLGPVQARCSGVGATSLRRRAHLEVKFAAARGQVGSRKFNGGAAARAVGDPERHRASVRVYTPFKRRRSQIRSTRAAAHCSRAGSAPATWPQSASLASTRLACRRSSGTTDGRPLAARRSRRPRATERFIGQALAAYSEDARPARPSTDVGPVAASALRRNLPRARCGTRCGAQSARNARVDVPAELLWREFAHHLLYHFPHTPLQPLDRRFERFPWATDAAQLRAWQRGRTGFPIVDAGMRELWATGWMHNRVRMIVGVVPGEEPAASTGRRARAGSGTRSSTRISPATR